VAGEAAQPETRYAGWPRSPGCCATTGAAPAPPIHCRPTRCRRRRCTPRNWSRSWTRPARGGSRCWPRPPGRAVGVVLRRDPAGADQRAHPGRRHRPVPGRRRLPHRVLVRGRRGDDRPGRGAVGQRGLRGVSAPSRAGDERFLRRSARLERAIASPRMVRAHLRALLQVDVRPHPPADPGAHAGAGPPRVPTASG
jgi:hypothetical protein